MAEASSHIESIRRRPGMYVGATDTSGIRHLLYWAFDDILSNFRAGRGTGVTVELFGDDVVAITDDAPVAHGSDGSDLLETVGEMIENFPSDLRDRGTAPGRQVRSYLPLVCALSEWCEVSFFHEHDRYVVRYEQGKFVSRSKVLGSVSDFKVHFKPDMKIFDGVLHEENVRDRLEHMVATCPRFKAELRSEQGISTISMPRGVATFLENTLREELFDPDPVHRLVVRENEFEMDLAIAWVRSSFAETKITSWANTILTTDGTHILGLNDALRNVGIAGAPFQAALSVFLPQPRYSKPTKSFLASPEMRSFVRDHVTTSLRRLVDNDLELATLIEELRR